MGLDYMSKIKFSYMLRIANFLKLGLKYKNCIG